MTTRRNAFDNDILADLGINAPSAATGPAAVDSMPTTGLEAVPPNPNRESGLGRTKRIGVDVTEEVWIAIKVVAAQQGTTVASIIRSHLADLIGDQGQSR